MEKQLRRKKRSIWMLLLGLGLLGSFGYFIYTYSPSAPLPISILSAISPLAIFFLTLFLSLFCLCTFFLNHTRRGFLLSLFFCSLLLLRLNHLTEIYFGLILLALFISLEIFFTRYH